MMVVVNGLVYIARHAVHQSKKHIDHKQLFLHTVFFRIPQVQPDGKMPEHKHLDKQLEHNETCKLQPRDIQYPACKHRYKHLQSKANAAVG